MADPGPAILGATELVVRYNQQVVLDGATLTLHEHERIGLVGRNGSGKSPSCEFSPANSPRTAAKSPADGIWWSAISPRISPSTRAKTSGTTSAPAPGTSST